MSYLFKGTPFFRRALRKLLPPQKKAARRAFIIFKTNPFDPRLEAHKIHHLSKKYKRTIYAVKIEADLRAVFYIERNLVVSLDIGTHDIYKR